MIEYDNDIFGIYLTVLNLL